MIPEQQGDHLENRPHIAIVGGGFGGLEAAMYLRGRLGDRAGVTLIADRDDLVFKPYMTYIPFGLAPEQLRVDLAEIAFRKGVRFIRDHVQAVDPSAKVVRAGGRALPFDFLVLATGAGVQTGRVPGLEEHAYGLWHETDLVLLRSALDHLLRDVQVGRPWRVVFQVPPGSRWAGPLYETAFMLETWLHWQGARASVELVVSTPEAAFMEAVGPHLHQTLTEAFARRGIVVRMAQEVVRVEAGALSYADGSRLPYDLLIASPTYAAFTSWANLPADEAGFILTQPGSRQVQGHPDIYAVGDVSDFPVKQAFLALLQADAAAEHIAARVLHTAPAFRFDPRIIWLMEQFDQAVFAHVPLPAAGEQPVPEEDVHIEVLPVGELRRLAIRSYLPWRLETMNPLYAGLLWKGTGTGLRVLPYLKKLNQKEQPSPS